MCTIMQSLTAASVERAGAPNLWLGCYSNIKLYTHIRSCDRILEWPTVCAVYTTESSVVIVESCLDMLQLDRHRHTMNGSWMVRVSQIPLSSYSIENYFMTRPAPPYILY